MKKRFLLTLACSVPFAVPLSAFDLNAVADRAASLAEEQAAAYDLPPGIVDKARELASSLGLTKANITRYANDGLKALGDGKYAEALNSLGKVSSAELSAGQSAIYQDLKVMVDTYVLQRSFNGDAAGSGPIADAMAALKKQDYAGVSQELQEALAAIKPTGEQREVLNALKQQYAEWATQPEAN